MELSDLIVQDTENLRHGLEILNKNGMGTLFVVDANEELKGIVTDGDIRRALIRTGSVDINIDSIVNRSFVSLPYDADNATILAALNSKIKIIPLVDEKNKVVDYASVSRIRRITVAAPLLNGNELAYVTDCIKTGWISSQGKYVRRFEELFAELYGMQALAVSNGTVALHLALEALGIGDGDEVLVPDLTFAASVNAIIYTGATPVLVDIDPVTFTLDVVDAEMKITNRTKAIMPVHLYGFPCDMDAIMSIASRYDLKVVEDCAEALGSEYKGKLVGTFGDASTFSFFGNKTITTGEGGMVLFKGKDMFDRASILRDHGMQKDRRYWHQEVGYNYRMTNLQGAVGVAQFERLNEFVEAKRNIAASYSTRLQGLGYFILPKEESWVKSTFWLYTLVVKDEAPFTRNDLIKFLGSNGVETRPVFYCMHEMPPYKSFGSSESLKVSRSISAKGMSLPSSVSLTEIEVAHICNMVKEFYRRF